MHLDRKHSDPTWDNLQDNLFSEYIGVVVRTHGLNGWVVLGETAGLMPTLEPGDQIAIGYSRDHSLVFVLEYASVTSSKIVIGVKNISSAEDAQKLCDQAVYVTSEQAGTQDQSRYSVGDIEGCSVVTDDGVKLGEISEVWLLPANDVWVCAMDDGTTIPLPVIDDVILDVNIESKTITVHLIDGLVDVNSAGSDANDE